MPVRTSGAHGDCAGHEVTDSEWELIEQVTRDFSNLPLTELAGTICELLNWRRPNGGLKSVEGCAYLQELRENGMLPWLPAPKPAARRTPKPAVVDPATDPQPPVTGSLDRWAPVKLERLDTEADRSLFRQFLQRYHPSGHKQACGAQLRYFVRTEQEPHLLLGCLLFTSAAWKMTPRDEHIGWNAAVRPHNLPRVVHQARFLILPWVRIPHLASHILAQSIRQVKIDWEEQHAVRPVLVEALVDRTLHRGTCYRAANWVSAGFSNGRTRQEIFLYPLSRSWREQLCTPLQDIHAECLEVPAIGTGREVAPRVLPVRTLPASEFRPGPLRAPLRTVMKS